MITEDYVSFETAKLLKEKGFNVKPFYQYYVSSCGRVFGCKGNEMKQTTTNRGYKRITLSINKKEERWSVHRLVALLFVPNPNGYPYINHKDEDKTNNHVDNLEWCTTEYNSNYGACKERIGLTNGIPVLKYDLKGNFICEYQTMTEAERNEGIDHSNICICCEGKISHCNNFIWIYKGNEHTIQDRIKKVKNSITRPKKLEMFDRNGKYIRTYNSVLQASKTSSDSYMIINRQLKTGIITKNAIHIWKQV